ncbi:MAG: threonine ammonia-lyase [Bacteroidia bacterium]|nr:threonine ammonia-lyase [Bacteroidia bacterium]
MAPNSTQLIELSEIEKAYHRIKGVARKTPLERNDWLSKKFEANIYLKREDLQVVRSYKIRGAYNNIATCTERQLANGVVCASAGNHAQGFAFACKALKVQGKVFMPVTTPGQKIEKVRTFGEEYVEIILVGDTYDEAYREAIKISDKENLHFIHPFSDRATITGQATVGKEIFDQFEDGNIDYLLLPVGGGGLAAGVGSYSKQVSPSTKIIGLEPEGAPAMYNALSEGKVVRLEKIDRFVDGAAVQEVGDYPFTICKTILDDLLLVPEGRICSYILDMYNHEAIVVEPAGVISIAGLEHCREEIKGKNIVCLVSGGNNDITRTEEIKERSLLFEGLKHYFIITFPQRAGALRDFLNEILGPNDDITHFQYTKKTSRTSGPAVVGIRCATKSDYERLIQKMEDKHIHYEHLNNNKLLFDILV